VLREKIKEDLGPTKQIFTMKISRERSTKLFWPPWERYIEKVLERFNINDTRFFT
jgi:hypothetical protein